MSTETERVSTPLTDVERDALMRVLMRMPFGSSLTTLRLDTVDDLVAVLDEFVTVLGAHETICQSRERRLQAYDERFDAARMLARRILDGEQARG